MQHLQIPSQKAEFFSSAKIHLENWFVGKELGAKSEILSVLPNTKKLKIVLHGIKKPLSFFFYGDSDFFETYL
jgi:hypothetical protein